MQTEPFPLCFYPFCVFGNIVVNETHWGGMFENVVMQMNVFEMPTNAQNDQQFSVG